MQGDVRHYPINWRTKALWGAERKKARIIMTSSCCTICECLVPMFMKNTCGYVKCSQYLQLSLGFVSSFRLLIPAMSCVLCRSLDCWILAERSSHDLLMEFIDDMLRPTLFSPTSEHDILFNRFCRARHIKGCFTLLPSGANKIL